MQVKKKICVPSPIREKHVEAKIVLKFPTKNLVYNTSFQEKLGRHFMLSSNTAGMCHFIACIHMIPAPIFIKTVKLLICSIFSTALVRN